MVIPTCAIQSYAIRAISSRICKDAGKTPEFWRMTNYRSKKFRYFDTHLKGFRMDRGRRVGYPRFAR